MANVIRYKTSQPTKRGLRRGNVVVGTGEENYGPTSTTGYVNGITPPDGGYVVYILSSNNDPAIYVANNDNDLVNIANTIGGSVSTIADAKTYLAGRANTWMLNSIPNNTTTDGLIAHIQSNRLSSYPETGTTVYDLSGEGNNGTLQNGTVFNNEVWELDGVNDRIDIADPGYPSSGTDPFSIDITFMVPTGATWYINGSGTAIIGRGSYAGSLGIFRSSTEGRVSFWARLNGGNIYDPAVTGITRDKWHHIVGTFDGNDTAKIYHNGEYIAQEVNTNNAGTFDADQYSIGGNTAFGGNNGQYGGIHIAEAKIYNKALSADEVSRNFYKGNTVTNNLKLHLDAGNLLSTQDESAWFDLSGNGYTATKYGSPNLTTLGGAKCWELDSVGDYFDINNTFSGLSACTLEAWIYPAASELSSGDRGTIIQGTIYMSWNKSNRRLSSYWYSTNNQGYHEPSKQLAREEWHHLCTVWTGTQLLQYIDGKLENTVTTTVSNGSMGARIGRESDGRQFAGGISMIKVYTDALTAEEVANHYNSYKARYGK